jgi:hypothetical protein
VTEHLVAALARFVRSIAVLALPAEGQRQWLDSLGLPGEVEIADELALEFDDGFLLLPQFVGHGWIAERTAGKLRELDSLLSAMSEPENAAVWDVSVLGSAKEWAEVREKAVGALFDL